MPIQFKILVPRSKKHELLVLLIFWDRYRKRKGSWRNAF